MSADEDGTVDEVPQDVEAAEDVAADARDDAPTGGRSGLPQVAGAASRVLVVLAVLAVLAGLYADTELGLDIGVVQLSAGDQATAGIGTCAALDLEGAGDTVVVAVADDVTGEDAVGAAASIRVLDPDGEEQLVPEIAPGELVRVQPDVAEDGTVSGRWEVAPLQLSRRLTADASARVAGGVEGPCPTRTSSRWFVPGVVTAGGASATLHIANPTPATAAVRVTFTTPEGRIEPTRLGNVVVPAGGRTVVDLNEFVPERADLGVDVEARSGRVVVEAVQQLEAAVGGVDGRSLVTAVAEPAEEWTVPFVDGTDDASSWLWVTNPGDASTEVRVVVHGPAGPFVPPGAGTTLAAGTTQRIDLRGVLAGTVGAVTVRSSEGAPVVVAGAVLREGEPPTSSPDPVTDGPTPAGTDPDTGAGTDPDGGEDPDSADDGSDEESSDGGTDADDGTGDDADGGGDEPAERGGIAIVEAVAAGAGRSVVLTDVIDDRARMLWVSNPGDEDVLVTVGLVRTGGRTTTVSRDVAVTAGATVPVVVEPGASGAVAVVVEVEGGRVAAALVSATPSGPLELTALTARTFVGEPVPVIGSVRRDRTILHPIDPGPAADPTAPAELPDGIDVPTGTDPDGAAGGPGGG